jgi:hypothetical protein
MWVDDLKLFFAIQVFLTNKDVKILLPLSYSIISRVLAVVVFILGANTTTLCRIYNYNVRVVEGYNVFISEKNNV